MKSQNNRGFEMIELLVVIAVISILSSVVLASLNTAREKAQIACDADGTCISYEFVAEMEQASDGDEDW